MNCFNNQGMCMHITTGSLCMSCTRKTIKITTFLLTCFKLTSWFITIRNSNFASNFYIIFCFVLAILLLTRQSSVPIRNNDHSQNCVTFHSTLFTFKKFCRLNLDNLFILNRNESNSSSSIFTKIFCII